VGLDELSLFRLCHHLPGMDGDFSGRFHLRQSSRFAPFEEHHAFIMRKAPLQKVDDFVLLVLEKTGIHPCFGLSRA